MDSAPQTDIVDEVGAESPESRLQKLVPVVRSLAGKVRALGMVSAGSAVVLWWIWFDPQEWLAGVGTPFMVLAVLSLLLLLLPAVSAYVGYRTLQEILDLPAKLKGTAAQTAAQARDALASKDLSKQGRLFSFFAAIWTARRLLIDSSDAWGKAFAAVRLGRLASLPFVLGLLATFALNFVLIVVAAVALGLSVVF